MDTALVVIAGTALTAVAGTFYAMHSEESRRKRFVAELNANVSKILSGESIEINGQSINKDTMICTYKVGVSFFFSSSVRFHSRFTVLDSSEARTVSILASIATLLLGWWSIRGLFFTPSILVENLTNANRAKAISLLDFVVIDNETLQASAARIVDDHRLQVFTRKTA